MKPQLDVLSDVSKKREPVNPWNEFPVPPRRTPFTIFVPIRVTKPFTLSDRSEDRTSVEPGSTGAKRLTHSSRPSFRAAKDDWSEVRYHCSSLAWFN